MTRGPSSIADYWLVRAVMRENQVTEAEAAVAVEQVVAGIRAQLRDGRPARLHGIGDLKPGKWREPQPSSRGDQGFREISFRHPVLANTKAIGERDCGATLTATDRQRIRRGATASGLGKPQGYAPPTSSEGAER